MAMMKHLWCQANQTEFSRLSKKAPAAAYVHCANHCLNLTLNLACELVPIRNMFSIVGEVISFFNDSPKRRGEIEVTLLSICNMRFVQRHDSIMRFANNIQSNVSGLENIATSSNLDSRSKAKAVSLLESIERSMLLWHVQRSLWR